MKLAAPVLFLLMFTPSIVTADLTVVVNSTTCEAEYDLDQGGSITLLYFGSDLDVDTVCKMTFLSHDLHNDLCIDATSFENECLVSVEYHGGHFHSFDPDKAYCNTRPQQEWCSGFSKIFISFEKMRPMSILGDVDIQLQVSTKSTRSPDFNPAVTSLSILIAAIVVAAVITMALLVVAFVITYKQIKAKRLAKKPGNRASVLAATTLHASDFSRKERPSETENWMNLHSVKTEETGTENPAFEDTTQKGSV